MTLLTACAPQPSVSHSPVPSAGGTPALVLPTPGQPLDAETMLEAMRTSPRPDGVPDRLETELLAGRLADAIWTFDGAPWSTFVVGGSCGADVCVVEVAGTRSGGAGEDLWTFDVDPGTGAVGVQSADLRALPPRLVASLDELARSLAVESDLDGMLLATARWLPPPQTDRFVLSYRSGGEEGSCAAELTVDARSRRLVEEALSGC